MTDNASAPRSRRALLAAAAGGAAALAASAALPLTAMAAERRSRLAKGDRQHRRPRRRRSPTRRPTAMPSRQPRPGPVSASRDRAPAAPGSSVGASARPPSIRPMAPTPGSTAGRRPGRSTDTIGVGVVGVSDDWGVYGDGYVGVYGYGSNGVVGESQHGERAPGSPPTAWARTISPSTWSARSASAAPAARRSPRVSRPRPSRWPGSRAAAGSSPSSTAIEAVATSGPWFPPPAASRSISTPRCRRRHTWPGSC